MTKVLGLKSLSFITDDSLTTGLDDSVTNFLDSSGAAASTSTASATGGLTNVLYLTEHGDTNAISVNDIHQGAYGDCFLLSSIGEIAQNNPNFIKNMIHDNGNGTQTVTLHNLAARDFLGTCTVIVNDVFDKYSVNYEAGEDVVGNQKEIWPQVIEKAVATLDGGVNGSLSPIADGGYPFKAMEQLTGKAASWMLPSQVTLASLAQMVSANDLITFDTKWASNLGYGLYGGHCYMMEGIVGSGSTAAVHLGNPWGCCQPANVPISQLSHVFSEVDYGHC
jgi:hypothetical protein